MNVTTTMHFHTDRGHTARLVTYGDDGRQTLDFLDETGRTRVEIFGDPSDFLAIARAILNDVPLMALLAALDDETDRECPVCGEPMPAAGPCTLHGIAAGR